MTATATEVKNRFGEFMDKAQREPVIVEKTGRNYAVLLSHEEFERLQAMEDSHWGIRAKRAEERGYVGSDVAEGLLQELRDER